MSQAFSVMKTCLFSGDGFSLQGYQGAFRHECSISSIVKPQLPRGASPSGSVCCDLKLHLPSKRMLMLSRCQSSPSVSGNKRLKNTVVCQREVNSGLCFILSGFCFVCAFILSTFFAYVWCRVVGSWWPFAEAPGACQRLVCYPAGFPVI